MTWVAIPDGYVPEMLEMELLERAWGLIANAGGGEWTTQSPDWQEAAKNFRDEVYHPLLKRWVEQSADGP